MASPMTSAIKMARPKISRTPVAAPVEPGPLHQAGSPANPFPPNRTAVGAAPPTVAMATIAVPLLSSQPAHSVSDVSPFGQAEQDTSSRSLRSFASSTTTLQIPAHDTGLQAPRPASPAETLVERRYKTDHGEDQIYGTALRYRVGFPPAFAIMFAGNAVSTYAAYRDKPLHGPLSIAGWSAFGAGYVYLNYVLNRLYKGERHYRWAICCLVAFGLTCIGGVAFMVPYITGSEVGESAALGIWIGLAFTGWYIWRVSQDEDLVRREAGEESEIERYRRRYGVL